jgi:hypothetical protein
MSSLLGHFAPSRLPSSQTLAWVERQRASIVTGLIQQRRQRRLEAALVGYPIFKPPHCAATAQDTPEAAAENFAYFTKQQPDRIAHLRFLLSKYACDASNVAAVVQWYATHRSALLRQSYDIELLRTHEEKWHRNTLGLNVALDFAITLGAAIIATNPRYHWAVDPTAWGTGAILTDGITKRDLVREVALANPTTLNTANLTARDPQQRAAS